MHTPATPVTEFDDDLRRLVDDMFDTMDRAPGVGLAAPQVGVGKRVFVFSYQPEDGPMRRGVAVNPDLLITPVPLGDPDDDAEAEGCLSFPGERFPLRRAERAVLTAVDAAGAPIRLEAEGWFARILQHEFDHLNGILYTDRIDRGYERTVARITRKSGWGVPGVSWLPGVDHLED